MKNTIHMSHKEINKLKLLQQLKDKTLKQVDAARLSGVTDRTIRNWLTAYDQYGPEGLIHGNRGQDSPHQVPDRERATISQLITDRYPDFGPTLAAEKLAEHHQIIRDPKTIRQIMIDEGLWIPRTHRQGKTIIHRHWRERKAHYGELVQFDGSYHLWLEDRLVDVDGQPQELCLLAAIDDARGSLQHAQFVPHEGVLPVMGFWTDYIGHYGFPYHIYLDRFSTYKMTQKIAQDNPDLKTQLQRACDTLGVKLIFALSPQAKGRVERLFKTLQDRLVKELRLRNISTGEAANQYLHQQFIPWFNQRYARAARQAENYHRPLSTSDLKRLPETLCRIEQRNVHNDFTVSFQKQWYQLLPTKRLAIRPHDTVMIREYPDTSRSLTIRNTSVNYKPIHKMQRQQHTMQNIRILAPT